MIIFGPLLALTGAAFAGTFIADRVERARYYFGK